MTGAAAVVSALPVGTLDLAVALCRSGRRRLTVDTRRTADLAGATDVEADGDPDVDLDEVAAELVRPRLTGEPWGGPTAPLAVGAGAVHVDVVDDDVEVLEAVLAEVGTCGAEVVSAVAQERRLPVTPYRSPVLPPARRPGGPPWPPRPPATAPMVAPARGDLAGVRVVDLSTLWAGPLCTALLARHGADVVKVDPSCRPDGMRSAPAMYRHLNGDKVIADLDLRREADRAELDALLRRADLVVHSFTRRVMPNLGYGPDQLRALNPGIASLAVTAFPAHAPERDWAAYGGGIHAASGLGMVDGVPTPAPVSYPDPLAGWAAFDRAVELLGRPPGSRSAEVSLAEVVRPLVAAAGATAAGATA